MNKRDIPLSLPSVGEEEEKAVRRVLQSGWLAHGPEVKEFEQTFADYIGVSHAVALNSATSALHLALTAYGKLGEVILPSFTFVASANAVITAGCTPVFADIDPVSLCISPTTIEANISEKTIAIMPVHFGGRSCDMSPIIELAAKHGLMVLEDSAEAIGAEYEGKMAGSFGIGCFSFFPTKNLTCGEGGMLTTNDAELAEKVRTLRGHGIASNTHDRQGTTKPWRREAVMPGYNFRMPDVLAAIGRVQLDKLPIMNAARIRHAAWLDARLGKLEGVQIPAPPANGNHAYQMYTVVLDAALYNRDIVVDHMRRHGVGASVHFDPPVHEQQYYRENFPHSNLPVTESVARSILTLPMFPDMTEEMLERTAEAFSLALAAGRQSP